MWIVNSAGLGRLGLLDGSPPDGVEQVDRTPTGRLYGLDGWLADRVGRRRPDVAAAGRALLRHGVTGVTDATPFADLTGLDAIRDAVASGSMPHVVITGAPDLDVDGVGEEVGLSVGPAKLLVADHAPPQLDDVVAAIGAARRHRRPLAVHCVTRVDLVVTVAAFADAGSRPGDRIEHGAVIPIELRAELRRLGLTVVTQPNLVAERGDDYLVDVDPADLAELWPCASLLREGIPVGFGSDAPFGSFDPWRLIDAAVRRRTARGTVVGAGECIDPPRALERLLTPADEPGGPPRKVGVGAPADLCLLDRPLADALDRLPANPVRAVVRAGRLLERGA
jgi:predicted amidohydrolase YtcJ